MTTYTRTVERDAPGSLLAHRQLANLEFALDESLWGGQFPRPKNRNKRSILRAIQEQLGLKLTATRGPIDHTVIDRVERPRPN